MKAAPLCVPDPSPTRALTADDLTMLAEVAALRRRGSLRGAFDNALAAAVTERYPLTIVYVGMQIAESTAQAIRRLVCRYPLHVRLGVVDLALEYFRPARRSTFDPFRPLAEAYA